MTDVPPVGAGTRAGSHGLPAGELAASYRSDLFDDFLPFMDEHVIDHVRGGFCCFTGPDGTRDSDAKSSWFEGRGTWVYSFLYNNISRDERYLDVAQRSIELVMRSVPEGDALWPKELASDGRATSPPSDEVYGDLFIAEGLAEFAKATGQWEHWETARQIVLKCLRRYDQPDYCPDVGRVYLGPQAPPLPGARIQGTWMVFTRVLTQMLQMRPDPALERIADRCVEAITQHHYNPELGLINELLHHDLSRPGNEYSQLVYTGHCVEALWMLMDEALRRHDQPLFDTLAGWFTRHVEVAWDDVYGGLFPNLKHVDSNSWTTDKLLWVQEEALIGCLMLAEHTGSRWAEETFSRVYAYVRDKYRRSRDGSSFWMYASDRRVSHEAFAALPRRTEHFHHPRHLMLNLLTCERIAARDGTPS